MKQYLDRLVSEFNGMPDKLPASQGIMRSIITVLNGDINTDSSEECACALLALSKFLDSHFHIAATIGFLNL